MIHPHPLCVHLFVVRFQTPLLLLLHNDLSSLMSPHCLALSTKTGLAYTQLNVSDDYDSILLVSKGWLYISSASFPCYHHTHTHTSFPPFPQSSFPSPLSFQDAITAVFQDCDYPSLSRNKNLENFKRRCELTSYHAAFHNTQ